MLKRFCLLLIMSFLICSTTSVQAFAASSPPTEVESKWEILPAGTHVFTEPMLVVPKDFGKQVMAGAMAIKTERDELRAIVQGIPEQIEGIKAELGKKQEQDKAEILQAMAKEISAASKKSYWEGFRDGSIGTVLIIAAGYAATK